MTADPAGPLGTDVARGGLTTLAGYWLRLVVSVASLMVLSRLLTPHEVGVFALASTVVGVALILSDAGLSLASIQRQDLSSAGKSAILLVNVLVGALLGGLAFAVAPWLGEVLGDGDVTTVVRCLAPIFLVNGAVAQFRAEATRRLRFAGMARAEVIGQLAGLGVGIGSAVAGAGAFSLVAQQWCVTVVGGVLVVVVSAWRPARSADLGEIRALAAFGLSTVGTQLLNYAGTAFATAAVGADAGPRGSGLFSRALHVSALPVQHVASPLTRVVLPHLARVDDPTRFSDLFVRMHRLAGFWLASGAAVMALWPGDLVVVLLGGAWFGAREAVAVLAGGVVLQCLGYPTYWAFMARNMMGSLFWLELPGRLAIFGGAALLARSGVEAVAWAVTAGLALNFAVVAAFGVPRLGMRRRQHLRALLPALGGVVGVVAARFAVSPWLPPGGERTTWEAGGAVVLGASLGLLLALLWAPSRESVLETFALVRTALTRDPKAPAEGAAEGVTRRVALVVHDADAHGAVQDRVRRERVELRRAGIEVDVVSASVPSGRVGARMHRMLPGPARELVDGVRIARALRRLVLEKQPGVVVVHASTLVWFARRALPRWRGRLVFVAHALMLDKAGTAANSYGRAYTALYLIANRAALRADAVVCVSGHLAEVARRHGASSNRVTVVPNVVPVVEPRGPGYQTRDIDVLFVGRLSSEKGADLLLEAVARAGADLHVVVAGAGRERAALEERATALGIVVEFVGWVPHERVEQLLARARVLVAPSRYEAQGVAVLEALAGGTPVVCTSVGGLREAVSHGVSGYLAPPEDPAALAVALGAVLSDAKRWERLRAGALDSAARYVRDVVWEPLPEAYAPAGVVTHDRKAR